MIRNLAFGWDRFKIKEDDTLTSVVENKDADGIFVYLNLHMSAFREQCHAYRIIPRIDDRIMFRLRNEGCFCRDFHITKSIHGHYQLFFKK